MCLRFVATGVLVAFAFRAIPLPAQSVLPEWNQFRGPNGCGVAHDCRPPVFIDKQKADWMVRMAPGHSSPVLSQQLVVLTAIEDGRLVTLAFEKQTGQLA